IDSSVLVAVQEALLADEQIGVEYRGMDSEEIKPMRLHPLGMVSRGPVTYLVATAFDYADVRLYAVHRMTSATRTGEPIKRPDGFDLDAYIQAGGLHFGNGKTVRLSAWVTEWLARILEETPLSLDQKLQSEGDRVKLTATVADSWQLHWWLMSQGNGIEVTAPVALRRKISKLLADAAKQYVNQPAKK
ncbi:MAG: WYL domain-containing protein, partial [Nitrosomonadales bacterium]|nr:WYL domain-containing protein [Nitrosomonadales bacterium]